MIVTAPNDQNGAAAVWPVSKRSLNHAGGHVRHGPAIGLLVTFVTLGTACGAAKPSDCGAPPAADPAAPGELVNLADRLATGRLRAVNRETAAFKDGPGLYVAAAPGTGVIWIDGTHLGDGTIQADVCGRDVAPSYLGLAFHRRNDTIFEAVYLRPFNFRALLRQHRGHAVQYIALPENDYSRLREAFPGQFEKPVDASVLPTAWVPLRVDIENQRVRVFVGDGNSPALDVRELQPATPGQVGLYVDNSSDGVFANLRLLYGSPRSE